MKMLASVACAEGRWEIAVRGHSHTGCPGTADWSGHRYRTTCGFFPKMLFPSLVQTAEAMHEKRTGARSTHRNGSVLGRCNRVVRRRKPSGIFR